MEKIKYESKEEQQFYSHMGEITRNYSTDTPHKWPFAIHS